MDRPARFLTAWRSTAGIWSAVLILAQTVWRGIYLFQGYFTQDDFAFMRIARAHPLGPGLLFQNNAGHFAPVQWLWIWATARFAGLDWGVAAATLLGTQLVAAVLFWLVLTRILPGNVWRLPLLGLFLFSPLSLWSMQWWAQAVGYIPSTVCLLAALLGALHWVQDGRRSGGWACVLFVTVGQLIQERAIFYPFVVLAVLLLLDPNKGVVARARSVVRLRWPMLLGLAATTTAFLVAHLLLALPTEKRQSYTAEAVLQLAGNYVGRTLLPGLAGGPWSFTVIYGGILVPAEISVVAVAILVAVLMVWTLWRGRGPAVGAWVMFWCYVALNMAAVMVGRPQFGTLIGLLPRYAADVVPVAALSLALVVRSVHAVPDPRAGGAGSRGVVTTARLRHASRVGRSWKGRLRNGLPWLATVALIVSCALTTTAIAPQGYNRDDEQYVATLTAGLHSDPEVVLYDSRVPDNVMISWFGDRQVTSTVLAGTDEHAVFDVPSENMRMVNDQGRLVGISLSFPTRAPRGPVKRCGYAVGSSTTILLPKRLKVRRAVMQLTYFADRQNVMTLGTGGIRQLVPIRRGAHVVDVVVSGTFDEVVLSQQDLGTVCVTALTVGSPTPGP